MANRLMTEEQYSTLHNKLSGMTSPWDSPTLFGQPGEAKAKWRKTVDAWLRALDEVLSHDG